MNPFIGKEVSELKQSPDRELGTLKAFENTGSEVSSVENIKTKNQDLEGKKHPETGVEYKRHRFKVDGKIIDGVFPVFDSRFDIKLPKDLYLASDDAQFKYCTNQLAKQLERDPELKKQFTSRQLEQIENGEPRISGLTWHHNESPGMMQLVDADIHAHSAHIGGRSIWGGGTECRT